VAESIAEVFFLIGLDEFTGKVRGRPDLWHSGVAGGVFADLALRHVVRIDDAGVVRPAATADRPPAGSAAAYVLDAVAGQERGAPVRRWVEELGPAVFELVHQQLADAAVIRREQGGGPRRAELHLTVDLVAAATPRMTLGRLLCDPSGFTLRWGVVAVLVDTAGLAGTFGTDRNTAIVREIVAEIADHLPGDLRAIVTGVRAAQPRRVVIRQ
jgi:Golgi phosphoprotein 3 (GPP34)